jgi:hypothetical protein
MLSVPLKSGGKQMKWPTVLPELIVLVLGTPALSRATQLQPDTLKAWDDYIQNADANMQLRLDGQRPFLWADEAPDRRARLRGGETLIAPVTGRGVQSVANGLIHDWIGAVFIPNSTLESFLAVIHDYDHYKEYYRPAVADSKVLACTNTDQKFSMVLQNRMLFVSAAVQGQYEAHDFVVSDTRGYNIANTVEVREIRNYGQNGEYLLPPGQGNGFIWRLHSISRYEERDGGVYVELEAIALTRDIPAALRWIVSPAVRRLSASSLTTSLGETRAAVVALNRSPQRIASCTTGRRGSAPQHSGAEK